ncbi:MAG: hemerythrin domain-containing protein [Planctomycetota bacterium]|nr:hemerythrin domain-containing protein [Planctomycetota bacterium]MDA0934685.1 hemerythrin domain-containing protein [Planctomycetota bacterium]MDA1222858.1 hemerythrin domain-containing protein [Planctomycetota bacterium]
MVGSTHPLDALRDEHDRIFRVLTAMRAEAQSAVVHGRVDADFWSDALRFLAGYAAHWHDAREEAVFDLVAENDEIASTLRLLRAEHIQARGLVHELRVVVGARDARSIELAAHALAALLHRHILIEEELFQRVLRRQIPEARLGAAMRRAVSDEAECRARALEELAEHVIASVSPSRAC